MRIRPTDERVKLPLDKTFDPREIAWSWRAPEDHYEVRIGWITLEMDLREFTYFANQAQQLAKQTEQNRLDMNRGKPVSISADAETGPAGDLLHTAKLLDKVITDEGAQPHYHRFVMAEFRRKWPLLWGAIDKICDLAKSLPSEDDKLDTVKAQVSENGS